MSVEHIKCESCGTMNQVIVDGEVVNAGGVSAADQLSGMFSPSKSSKRIDCEGCGLNIKVVYK